MLHCKSGEGVCLSNLIEFLFKCVPLINILQNDTKGTADRKNLRFVFINNTDVLRGTLTECLIMLIEAFKFKL